jgi:hypothetical protein
MKTILLAVTLMCGSAFAQYPSPAGGGGTADYPPAGGYGAPSSAYTAPGQDPYSIAGGIGAPESYPSGAGYEAPAACGPGYVWIDGYTDANGYFVNGYCTAPPFAGAYWVAPSFFGGRFVAGYWGRGGIGYASGFGVRGGYRNYGVPGGYREAPHVGGGYSGGFRAPTASAPSFRSQGGNRGGGPSMHGGGQGYRGRR